MIRGLPERRKEVALRLDADVLRWFRSLGAGCQDRINAALRAYMEAHAHRPE